MNKYIIITHLYYMYTSLSVALYIVMHYVYEVATGSVANS